MKIRFITDFARNWKTGDVVEIEFLSDDDTLVDNVACIDTALLMEHCEVVTESEPQESEEWVNFADDLIPIIDEAESEEEK